MHIIAKLCVIDGENRGIAEKLVEPFPRMHVVLQSANQHFSENEQG